MRDENRADKRELPIGKIVPRKGRIPGGRPHRRIEASLRAIGLREPLAVLDRGDSYEILDGHCRYEILKEMGVKTIPCFIYSTPPTNQEPTHA